MPRTTAVRRLKHMPLTYFLAQVRFSEIVNIVKYIPEIQDRLRLMGFPIFRQTQIPQLLLENGIPAFRTITLSECRSKDLMVGIVIAPTFVVYQTTAYTIYEDFEPRFADVLSAIHAIVGVGIMERCGLRYINLVRPRRGKSLRDYLKPEILGLRPEEIGVTDAAVNYLFQGNTEVGKLLIRFTTPVSSGSLIPADLQAGALPVSSDLSEKEIAGLLDFDHFSENRVDFAVQTAMDALGGLHQAISAAFESATTPEALALWGADERH